MPNFNLKTHASVIALTGFGVLTSVVSFTQSQPFLDTLFKSSLPISTSALIAAGFGLTLAYGTVIATRSKSWLTKSIAATFTAGALVASGETILLSTQMPQQAKYDQAVATHQQSIINEYESNKAENQAQRDRKKQQIELLNEQIQQAQQSIRELQANTKKKGRNARERRIKQYNKGIEQRLADINQLDAIISQLREAAKPIEKQAIDVSHLDDLKPEAATAIQRIQAYLLDIFALISFLASNAIAQISRHGQKQKTDRLAKIQATAQQQQQQLEQRIKTAHEHHQVLFKTIIDAGKINQSNQNDLEQYKQHQQQLEQLATESQQLRNQQQRDNQHASIQTQQLQNSINDAKNALQHLVDHTTQLNQAQRLIDEQAKNAQQDLQNTSQQQQQHINNHSEQAQQRIQQAIQQTHQQLEQSQQLLDSINNTQAQSKHQQHGLQTLLEQTQKINEAQKEQLQNANAKTAQLQQTIARAQDAEKTLDAHNEKLQTNSKQAQEHLQTNIIKMHEWVKKGEQTISQLQQAANDTESSQQQLVAMVSDATQKAHQALDQANHAITKTLTLQQTGTKKFSAPAIHSPHSSPFIPPTPSIPPKKEGMEGLKDNQKGGMNSVTNGTPTTHQVDLEAKGYSGKLLDALTQLQAKIIETSPKGLITLEIIKKTFSCAEKTAANILKVAEKEKILTSKSIGSGQAYQYPDQNSQNKALLKVQNNIVNLFQGMNEGGMKGGMN